MDHLFFNSQNASPTTILKFKNRFPVKFWFAYPELIQASEYPTLLSNEEQKAVEERMKFINSQPKFFPIGIYGISTLESLIEIKKAGFNTALIPPQTELVQTATDLGIKTIINICSGLRDPNKVISTISRFASDPSLLAWYIADEPEISPFLPKTFVPIIKTLNKYDPVHPACVAMNRAWLVPNYQKVNNIFMMDEYPIPNMPLTWLTTSLDQAKSFSYSYAFSNQSDWQNLAGIISELNFIYPWLTIANNPQKPKLTVTSPYKAGGPAIHFCIKKKDDKFLLIAVNALDHPTEMIIEGLPKTCKLLNVLFENRKIVVKEGFLRDSFAPFETHIYFH